MRVSILYATSVLAFLGAAAITQNWSEANRAHAADTAVNNGAGPSADDVTFMKKLAQGGLAEVEVGKMAVKRANDKDVKEFAQHMVDDHSKTNEKLKSLASERQVSLPTVIDPEQSATKSKLEMQGGAAFDADYMSVQVKDHQKTVELLRHQIGHGQDAGVKGFAKDTLPTVSHHLEMARQIHAKVGDPSSGDLSPRKTSKVTSGSNIE